MALVRIIQMCNRPRQHGLLPFTVLKVGGSELVGVSRIPGVRSRNTWLYRWLLGAIFVLATMAGAVHATEDPLEPVNRAVFEFNNTADRFVLRPVAQGYDTVMPSFARVGVSNFFSNFLDANAALNALLQGRLEYGFDNLGRVVVNTTLGFLGFFDVASDMGIPRYQTDFGHTLAVWGVPKGPYVMLPLLGPRTLRSTVGTFVDAYASPTGQIREQDAQWGMRAVELVDLRAGLLGTDQLLSGDQYIFIRDAYLQQRDVITSDGEAKDDFSEFDDDWEADDL